MVLESSGVEKKALSQKTIFYKEEFGPETITISFVLKIDTKGGLRIFCCREEKPFHRKSRFKEEFGSETITIGFALKNRYQKWS